MSRFLTAEFVDAFRQRVLVQANGGQSLTVTGAKPNVFLSHLSTDEDFLAIVEYLLRQHGGVPHMSATDKCLSPTASAEAVKKLRATIDGLPRFIVFVTPQSTTSKWIPWEIGLANGLKKDSEIALWPSAPADVGEEWVAAGYLGIYRRIIYTRTNQDPNPRWMVFNPLENRGVRLRDWLANSP
jgi:hypothetical protein